MDLPPRLLAKVGAILFKRRQRLKLTCRDVQELTGVDIGTLSLLERNCHKKGPRIDVLAKLAIALDLPLDTLLRPYIDYVTTQRDEPSTAD